MTMELQGINGIFGYFILSVFMINAQILPEPLVPYDDRNSVCYGQGTHGQFRPSCPDNESVIAVQQLRVGSKPIEADCPASVTKWTNHTGSYIVDHLDISKILDAPACCLPDESQDCMFVYSYTNSGIDYVYHIYSSGYSESKPDMEVSWETTRCDSTNYPSSTNFMSMDYSCIKRTKIGDMCSNSIYTTVGGSFYLYNTDYPNSVKATIASCQCDIRSDTPSLRFYIIDLRLKKYGSECKQSLHVTDSEGTTSWDCESAPIFNLTKSIQYSVLTLTFTNDLQIDDGNAWFGVSGDEGVKIIIECRSHLKQDMMQGTTSTQYTNTDTLSTVLPSERISSEEHRSTPSNEITFTHHESTLLASESAFTTQWHSVSTSETTFLLHASSTSGSESTITSSLPALSKSTITPEIQESSSSKSERTLTVYKSTASTSVSASVGTDATTSTSELTSDHESRTTSKYTTPNTQSTTQPFNIVITNNLPTIIVILIAVFGGLVVIILFLIFVRKMFKKPSSTISPMTAEVGTSTGTKSRFSVGDKGVNRHKGNSRERGERKNNKKYSISSSSSDSAEGSGSSFEIINGKWHSDRNPSDNSVSDSSFMSISGISGRNLVGELNSRELPNAAYDTDQTSVKTIMNVGHGYSENTKFINIPSPRNLQPDERLVGELNSRESTNAAYDTDQTSVKTIMNVRHGYSENTKLINIPSPRNLQPDERPIGELNSRESQNLAYDTDQTSVKIIVGEIHGNSENCELINISSPRNLQSDERQVEEMNSKESTNVAYDTDQTRVKTIVGEIHGHSENTKLINLASPRHLQSDDLQVEQENTTQDTATNFAEETRVETKTKIPNGTPARNSQSENTLGASKSSNPGQCRTSYTTLLDDIILESGKDEEGNADVNDAENSSECEPEDDKNVMHRGRKRAKKHTLKPIVLPKLSKEQDQTNERNESKIAKQKSMKRDASPIKGKHRKRNRSKGQRKK